MTNRSHRGARGGVNTHLELHGEVFVHLFTAQAGGCVS